MIFLMPLLSEHTLKPTHFHLVAYFYYIRFSTVIDLKDQLEGKRSSSKDSIPIKTSDTPCLDAKMFENPPVICVSSIKQSCGILEFKPARSYGLITPRPQSEGSNTSRQTNVPNEQVDTKRIDSTSSSSVADSGSSADVRSVQSTDNNTEDNTSRSSTPSDLMYQPDTHFLTKFSEGEAVLERLVSAFWPGPVVIFAPARLKAASDGSPTLPLDVLVKVKAASDTVEKCYVGLRCPSHPLAQRFLREAKTPVVSFSTISNTRVCSSAFDVQTALQSCARPPHIIGRGCRKLTVLCINGEDKREIFAVPTCELGCPSTIVLVEEETRHLHVLRNGAKITAYDIKNALRKSVVKINVNTRGEAEKRRNQIVRAVLMKWKVVQHVA